MDDVWNLRLKDQDNYRGMDNQLLGLHSLLGRTDLVDTNHQTGGSGTQEQHIDKNNVQCNCSRHLMRDGNMTFNSENDQQNSRKVQDHQQQPDAEHQLLGKKLVNQIVSLTTVRPLCDCSKQPKRNEETVIDDNNESYAYQEETHLQGQKQPESHRDVVVHHFGENVRNQTVTATTAVPECKCNQPIDHFLENKSYQKNRQDQPYPQSNLGRNYLDQTGPECDCTHLQYKLKLAFNNGEINNNPDQNGSFVQQTEHLSDGVTHHFRKKFLDHTESLTTSNPECDCSQQLLRNLELPFRHDNVGNHNQEVSQSQSQQHPAHLNDVVVHHLQENQIDRRGSSTTAQRQCQCNQQKDYQGGNKTHEKDNALNLTPN